MPSDPILDEVTVRMTSAFFAPEITPLRKSHEALRAEVERLRAVVTPPSPEGEAVIVGEDRDVGSETTTGGDTAVLPPSSSPAMRPEPEGEAEPEEYCADYPIGGDDFADLAVRPERPATCPACHGVGTWFQCEDAWCENCQHGMPCPDCNGSGHVLVPDTEEGTDG